MIVLVLALRHAPDPSFSYNVTNPRVTLLVTQLLKVAAKAKKVAKKAKKIAKKIAKEEAAKFVEEEPEEEEEESEDEDAPIKGDIHIMAASGLPKVDLMGLKNLNLSLGPTKLGFHLNLICLWRFIWRPWDGHSN